MREYGVLFDLDGVLVDTEGIYTGFWAAMGHEFGLTPTFASDIKGTTLTSILKYFPEDKRDYVVGRIHDFENDMPYDFFDGTERAIAELKSNGAKLAIVTSSDDVKMGHLYARHPGFREMFDAIIDASMVTRSKPDPQGYLLAASELELDAKQCVVVEDSLQGLEAGRRSGAKVVGFTTTNSEENVAPLCDLCLPSIKFLTHKNIIDLLSK